MSYSRTELLDLISHMEPTCRGCAQSILTPETFVVATTMRESRMAESFFHLECATFLKEGWRPLPFHVDVKNDLPKSWPPVHVSCVVEGQSRIVLRLTKAPRCDGFTRISNGDELWCTWPDRTGWWCAKHRELAP